MSKQIQVGSVAVGGAPVSIQSMCNTPTQDVAATVSQILRLEKAGCEIIRLAVPDQIDLHGSSPFITVGMPQTMRTTHSARCASRTQSRPTASRPRRVS